MDIAGKRTNGFTLIEIMVVLAIVGLMILVNLPRIHQYRLRTQLEGTVQEIKGEVRKVQTWSTAVKSGTPVEDADHNAALLAYAIHFVEGADHYVIWEVWEDAEAGAATFAETPDERKTVVKLPEWVTFQSFSPTQPFDTVDFLFEIPTGKIVDGSAQFDTEDKVEFTLHLNNNTDTFQIWKNGTISS
jgi:prepilin-type N-terminal cleavage/methylation domain-containing protein